ncbi:MAG: HlyD family efflux transporter periplasmic adaptor subunit [Dysgonamonadaceae bacterium]|nr:HlyD family efflux transporter periplasmic adaptor subunit [Dysgonamonadaceae bacterium]
MNNFRTIVFISLCVILITLAGCNRKPSDAQNLTDQSLPKTSVFVGYPSDTIVLNDEITLNATATYLLKSDVKANTTGYITSMHIKPADRVRRSQTLFTLQTKEARALGNTINELDPSFRFSGVTSVVSPVTGYVQMLNHQVGDYVQDGETLATITDENSFGFVMNVPYEYNQLIRNGNPLMVNLPDGRTLAGSISKIMPAVDPVAQTEEVLVKVKNTDIPENLIANIQLIKSTATGLCVPKTAVLTNDFQSDFWVMKLINDTTAIKVDISKGLETENWVQVLSDNITMKDRLVTIGNFGMSDTAYVTIQK